MKNVMFNNSDSADRGLRILSWERDPMPEIRDQYEYLPNRHGFVHFGQPFGSRMNAVEFRLFHRTEQERMDRLSKIMAWVHTADFERLEFDDEPDIYYIGKLNGKPEVTNITRFHTDFLVEWICYPFKLSKKEYGGSFDMDGLNPVHLTVGGTQETPPLIDITVLEDAAGLTVQVNDEELNYDGDVATNNRVVIDTGELEFRLNDEIKVIELTGILPILKPGGNDITVSVRSQVSMTWREFYK